jgi:alpha-tubulin suppressor-like RCC1 family protein
VRIANVSIANSSYTVLDDTAVDTAGGYIVITGAGFNSGAQVIIGDTNATSVTRVSATELRAQVPAKSAATYNLYVVNTDGSTGIRVNGLTYSGTPTWVTASTLDNQEVDVAFNVAFDATGATSYANTTVLPAGTTLLSNGYFYGTITGIEEETTYSFTVSAIDAENQDSPRTFSVTVTVSSVVLFTLYQFGVSDYLNMPAYSSPVQVGSTNEWQHVHISRYNNFGVKADGTLWSWGAGFSGSLGLNDRIYRSSPTQVGTLTNWYKAYGIDPDYPFSSTNAIKTDGTIWSWGSLQKGYSGLNLVTVVMYGQPDNGRSSPTQIGTSTDWADLGGVGLALKTDGTLWTWGDNFYGKLGLNDTNNRSSPTQVGSGTDWSRVTMGSKYNRAALKTNGTLWAWGYNNVGSLGLNNTIDKSSPTQVGSGTDWSRVTMGSKYNRAALKTNGTLWAWGYNNIGSLGLNNTIDKSSPTQVGSGTDWSDISIGFWKGAGIKTDGTLWTWGKGSQYGFLGLNDLIDRSSPTQVGSDTNWSIVSVGAWATGAIKTNGTFWTWGHGSSGTLGLNDTAFRSSPTQVGSDTTWSYVDAGADGVLLYAGKTI